MKLTLGRTTLLKGFLSSRLFVLQDWHGGQALEVEKVPDGLPHDKDVR